MPRNLVLSKQRSDRTFVDCSCPREVALFLHGYPGDAMEAADLFPCFVHCGLSCVAVDMPGFGESPGARPPGRSECNNLPGGPVDIAAEVLRRLGGGRPATLYGHDWGAGVALSLALRYPALAGRVVALHPSYQERAAGELARQRAPALVLWVAQDQLHPLARWRPLARSMPYSVN